MTLPKSAIAFFAVIAALTGGYYWATEPVTYMAPGPLPSEVRHNPWYAAQQLLQEWHHPTRRVFSTGALFPLPGPDTTLIIDGHRGRLGSQRTQQLLAWVQAGGRLIIATTSSSPLNPEGADQPGSDPLMKALGIVSKPVAKVDESTPSVATVLEQFQPMSELFLRYCLDNPSGERLSKCEALTCEGPVLPAPAIARHFGEQPRALQPMSPRIIRPVANADDDIVVIGVAANDQGGKMIRLRDGKGKVTVLTDLSLWDNDHLHYFDHAWLLRRLVGDGPVWLVRGISMPPLPRWLWQHAWPLLLGLAMALAAWLWRRLPRTGPIWRKPHDEHRDFRAHLTAIGHFHWRSGQTNLLLAPLRQRARRQLALLHPDPEQAMALAARRLTLDADIIDMALNSRETPRNPESWVHCVALLQRLSLLHQ